MRTTKNRTKILNFLENAPKAYSAGQIHAELKDIDLATIYRNLNLFVEEGLVRELSIDKDERLYEMNQDDHEHTICVNCGEIKHVKVNKAEIIKLLKLEDFEIDDIEINIKGRCKD